MSYQQRIKCYTTTYAVVKILLYGDLRINKYSYSYYSYSKQMLINQKPAFAGSAFLGLIASSRLGEVVAVFSTCSTLLTLCFLYVFFCVKNILPEQIKGQFTGFFRILP